MQEYIMLDATEQQLGRIDRNVQEILMQFPIILAGGAVRDACQFDTISDYDVFFTDWSELMDVCNFLEDRGFDLVFECPNGELYTYMQSFDPLVGNRKIETKVQLITKREYSNMEELLDSFDFNACVWGLVAGEKSFYEDSHVVTSQRALDDVESKQLSINRVTYPASTINRLYKYRNKGYYVGKAIQEIVRLINEDDESILENNELYID